MFCVCVLHSAFNSPWPPPAFCATSLWLQRLPSRVYIPPSPRQTPGTAWHSSHRSAWSWLCSLWPSSSLPSTGRECTSVFSSGSALSSEDQHPLWGVVTPERGCYCRKPPESPVDRRPLEPVTRCMVQVDWGWSGSRCIWVVYGPLTLLGGQMQSQSSGKKVTRPWPGVPYTTLSSFCTYTHFSHKGFQVACNTRHIK